MHLLKGILMQILGQKAYLKLASFIFLIAFRSKFLKFFKNYQTHYFIKSYIKSGDTVIDIGANLGYYSVPFAQYVGEKGTVLSVEPIPIYRTILQSNTRNYPQVQILPFALGKSKCIINMGIPERLKHRHGLMKILEDKQDEASNIIYTVEMEKASNIFSHLKQVHYIKCDVEGYENIVIPELEFLLNEFRPIFQVEISSENAFFLFDWFLYRNYKMYSIKNRELIEWKSKTEALHGDLIAIAIKEN